MRPDFAFSVGKINDLRSLTPANGTLITVEGYYVAGDGGGGPFTGAVGNVPGTYVENGGTIVLPAGGDGSSAWRRQITDIVSIKQFGAKGDGETPAAFAINAALSASKSVLIPEGDYLIESRIDIFPGHYIFGAGPGSRFIKGYDGDILKVDSFGRVDNITIDGNSDIYSGRGIIITSGSNPSGGYQMFTGVVISNTRDYNVEYIGDGVGFGSKWNMCQFSIPDNDKYCIKLPIDTSTGNRHFIGCSSPSDSMIDINGAANTNMVGCLSGRSVAGNLWCLGFSDESAQSIISGCRLAGGGQDGVIKGTLHAVTGCAIAANGITFAQGAGANKFRGNTTGAISWSDDSGQTGTSVNEFDVAVRPYIPTIVASGGGFAIGNGSINTTYSREGANIKYSGIIVIGSSTSLGAGAINIGLPFTSHDRNYLGNCRGLKMGVEFLFGVTEIAEGNATYFRMLLSRNGSQIINYVSSTVPVSWEAGDEIHFQIDYHG